MKKGFIKFLLLIGMLFLGMSNVHADDTFTFSIGGAKDVKSGDEFTVEAKVTGPNEVYSLNGYDLEVSYDAGKLTLIDGAPGNRIVRPEQGSINSDLVIATLRFRVNDGATESDVKLELKPNSVIRDGEEVKASKLIKFNAGTVSIRNVGSDSSLKSLKIPNTVLSPEFNPNIHDYKATVTDVTSIDIKAEPNEGHASVSVTPNAGALGKGDNDVTVVCQAENGTQSTYTIRVTLNVTPTEEELKAQDATLKALSIKGQKIEFTPSEKKYYINVDYDVTKLNITATPNIEGAEVVITGNTKLVVGKNTIKVTVTSTDKTKTDTYQIIVTRVDEEKKIVQTCPDETSKTEWIIFTVSLLVTFTLGIVLGYFLGKKEVFNKLFKKKNKKQEEPVEIETLSDTIDLTNALKKTKKEFEKNNNEK